MNTAPAPAAPSRLPVVLAADTRFLPGVLVTTHSLLRHLAPGWRADLTLLTDDFSTEAERALRAVVAAASNTHTLDVHRLSMDDFRNCPSMASGSRLAYARLLIPGLFPAEERVLYIDTDIVVGRDVSALAALPRPEGKVFHAVRDGRVSTCGMPWDLIPCAELGIPPEAPYFNSGFLWMDLAAWRRQDVSRACWEHIARFADRLRFYDQSVLNAVLWDRWTALDRAWNTLPEQALGRFALYPLAPSRDRNIHYATHKPWVKRSPFERLFWDEMAEVAALVEPTTFARPQWTRADAEDWVRLLTRRAYYHYGGFVKHGVRRLLGRRA